MNIPNAQANSTNPVYAIDPASSEERRKIIEEYNHILTELEPHEKIWAERYHMLLVQGLQLRPRMRPEWQPSWFSPDGDGNAFMSEDGEVLRVSSCFL
jgi:hypothetical protein